MVMRKPVGPGLSTLVQRLHPPLGGGSQPHGVVKRDVRNVKLAEKAMPGEVGLRRRLLLRMRVVERSI